MNNSTFEDKISEIPLADDDPQGTIMYFLSIVEENACVTIDNEGIERGRSMDSISSDFTSGSQSPSAGLDGELSLDEQEEKARLISQVMELQNTLDDLSQRVDSVKEENLKLRSENQVLGQYIENLMAASSVFQTTSPKSKKK
nr:EOG090X0N2I [Lepidurus arcticus]